MNLDEALAVYLYLSHQTRNREKEAAFNEAWGVIYLEAEKIIAARYPRD